MPIEPTIVVGSASALSLASDEVGHWITIEGQHIFVAGSAGAVPSRLKAGDGEKTRFSKAELQRHILAHHESVGGKGTYTAADESALNEVAGAGDPFTFHRKLPTEVKEFMAGRPELRSMFKVSGDSAHAGGADAFGALGDRYLDIAEAKAGSPLRAAKATAHASNDPEVKLLAAIHDNLPEGRFSGETIKAQGLRVGDQFTIGGSKFRVAEDSEGLRVLEGGKDYPDTPVDAIRQLPIDKGSFRHGKKPQMESAPFAASADGPIVLDASDLPAPQALPLALEGLPTFEEIPSDEEIGRQPDGSPIFGTKRLPISYFSKEVFNASREWAHRGEIAADGKPRTFALSRADLDETVSNFRALKQAGVKPFLPDYHTTAFDAATNNGEVIDLERKGNSLYAKLKVVGSAAIEKVQKNDVSVWLDNADAKPVLDATGKRYKGWVLHHVALTPNPAIPHLEPFARIAASADRPAMEAPVFSPAVTITPHAAPSRRSYRMKPETAQQVRAQLGFGADVPDDQLDDKAAEKALALSAEYPVLKESVTSLTARLTAKEAELATAKTALDAKSAENLALSATAPRMPDAVTMAMYAENVSAKREMAIQSGAITPAEAVLFDQLVLDASGKPTALALSACAGKPLGFSLWDVVCKLGKGGFRSGTARGTGVTEATPNDLGLSAEKKPDVADPQEVAYLRQLSGLPTPKVA